MSNANVNASSPEVSVVIPTHERETRLAFAFDALAEQRLPHDRFEVIVVRSRDAAPPFAPAPAGLRVRSLTYDGESTRPAKRNFGWRHAAGRLVAFTDDDCRPDPGWLAALLEGTGDERTFVQGRTEPDPDESHLLHGLARSVEVTGPSPWYPTCNMAFPRALLEELGGFDEAFVATGEDTDLGLRAEAHGARCQYQESALVRHAVLPQPLGDAMLEGWRRWDTTPLVFKRHPEHRRHLFAKVFFNRAHAALVLLALGAVAGRGRRRVAAAASLPYLLQGLDRQYVGPRGIVRQGVHFPARLLSEAAVAAGLVRGALRHRSPLI